jgi:VWFA-related protein
VAADRGEGGRTRRMLVLVLAGSVATGLPVLSDTRGPAAGGVEGLAGASGLAGGDHLQAKFAGRPLADVLRELQATGLSIVFSSEIVRPAMKVLTEPKAVRPREILDEILRPHGLQVRSGPGDALLVVPADAARQNILRTSTRVVPIYATVSDASGALVSNLTATDFQVDDNGKTVPITLFESGIQPITMAILVDRSPSLFPVAQRALSAVTELSRRLLPGDRACLGTFCQVVSLDPTLTADAGALVRRLGHDGPWPAGTALWDAVEAGRVALEREGGRRVILVVSDAKDNCSRVDVDALRARVQQDGIMIYAINIRGREGIDTSELGALARATGGWSFELKPADDVGAAARRVADELHRQYLLGFAPGSLDDKLHRIDVKVKKPGYSVHARRSYTASRHEDIR